MAVEHVGVGDKITGEGATLRRALGSWQLMAIGIGAIIGAGIFILTGQAAAQYAGPAVVLSVVLAGVGCAFAGLCYAELAAMIPVSGSAYTYAYAAFGRFAAWIIGWDLVLEYGLAASAVSVGWSSYFVAMLSDFGVSLPAQFVSAPVTIKDGTFVRTGAFINLPAMIIVVFLTALAFEPRRRSMDSWCF
jgi:APA family basic amino acid/polyamine antiporter